VAHRVGQGVVSAVHPVPGFSWSAVLVMGTVLADGEGVDSDRILAAAGPGAAVAYHTAHALTWSKDSRAFAELPNGEAWVAGISRVPRERRHLASWAKHLVGLTREDQAVLTPELVAQLTFTGTEVELRQRLTSLGEAGATEVIYQPMGPDIPGELARFARMAELIARPIG
jgi:5,10-methylenetetrahydromethanopterin reductase